jgi:tRNA pseudouridine55 synthase
MQAPPAHSAMKVGGKRAYELARAGEIDRLEPRPVIIHELRIESYAWPSLVLDVRCGKGTYIRSLARDIGRALGVGGHAVGPAPHRGRAVRRRRCGADAGPPADTHAG